MADVIIVLIHTGNSCIQYLLHRKKKRKKGMPVLGVQCIKL